MLARRLAELGPAMTALEQAAHDALTKMLKPGYDNSDGLKLVVIEFLLSQPEGQTNAQKQAEIDHLFKWLESEQGADVWLPMLYYNSEKGKYYRPHNFEEAAWVYLREGGYYWRQGLIRGGEGSGKSVGGIVKDLEWIRIGTNGFLSSPDFEHFKKSLWPEFKRWCPWRYVVDGQRQRGDIEWEPTRPYTIVFKTKAQVMCGGMDKPSKWDGVNITWAHLDEARLKEDDTALQMMNGRIRIPGPNGESPQMYFTSTPRKHWLYDYFGPWERQGDDPKADFKKKNKSIQLFTQDNETAGNVVEGYTQDRGRGLSETARNVVTLGTWENIEDAERFLRNIVLWDACLDPAMPAFNPRQAMVLAVDCGTVSDCFAVVGVCRHPLHEGEVAVRYCRIWKPTPDQPISLVEVENELIALCQRLHIAQIAYDPYQLKSMMERLYHNQGVWTEEFSQMGPREKADKQLMDMIDNRQLWHDGSFPDLRQHLDNANKKRYGMEGDQKMRIVKREESLKIDGAVALSMAVDRCLELNLY